MRRFAALLLSVGTTAVLSATPDLDEGRKRSDVGAMVHPDTPWRGGWREPVNPQGLCRFHYYRDKLTITLPGKDFGLDVHRGRLNAPRLLRTVRGDFLLQVRVAGTFRLASDMDNPQKGYRAAGILLTDGKDFIRVQRAQHFEGDRKARHHYVTMELLGFKGGGYVENNGEPLDEPLSLRVERRAGWVHTAFSKDGEKWLPFAGGPTGGVGMPQEIQVGVIAEATAPGEFRAEFDRFKLSPAQR